MTTTDLSDYTAEMAHAAAARGAAWMDEQCPGWVHEIDLNVLQMASGSDCILGQTAECLLKGTAYYKHVTEAYEDDDPGFDYDDVVIHLEIRPEVAIDLGFMREWRLDRGFATVEYEMLTIAWTELIRARLAAGKRHDE